MAKLFSLHNVLHLVVERWELTMKRPFDNSCQYWRSLCSGGGDWGEGAIHRNNGVTKQNR